MSDVVDRLINGFFEYESEKLVFSAHKIETSVVPGDKAEGSIFVSSRSGRRVKGSVYSSCMRVLCLTPEFDSEEFDLKYSFDSTGLEAGAIIKGDIQIVSDAGEYFIPFIFTIVRSFAKAGKDEVKNLFHFSNSAQTDWKEAVKTFYSEEFLSVFEGNDRQHLGKYRGFSTDPFNEDNLERFLISVKKKQPLEFKTDSSLYEFSNITSDLKCTVSVKKTTWGLIDLKVSTDCDFIEPAVEAVTGEDFLGNLYNLEFNIKEEALHEGRNFGRIILTHADGTEKLGICIEASRRTGKDPEREKKRERKSLVCRLMQQYIAFRMKQINKSTWIRESLRIVERMNSLDEKNPESRLYQAQLLLMDERRNEARWILEHIEREMKIKQRGDEYYSYFMYLVALYNRDEEYIDNISEEIKGLYQKTGSYRILWILLYIDTEYTRSVSRKLYAIREQYRSGCRSPLLYIEAFNCFASNPALLSEITDFELSVLCFALKNYKLDGELLERLIRLSERLKHAPAMLIKLLGVAYKLSENDEIVRVLCSLLIKDNLTDEKYFVWYKKGVEKDYNITRLYEYYMFSVPFDHRIVIPREVILYFNLSSGLSYERTAFLYANLIKHRGRQQELYESLLDQIRNFAAEQIMEEHIDKNLAVIYKHVLVLQMITPELAGHFVRILFAYELEVKKDAAYVVIVQEEIKGEEKYPVQRGYSYPVVYSHNYTVFLEDPKGRRSLEDPLKLHRLLDDSLYLEAVKPYVSDIPGFCLYVCTVQNRYVYVDAGNVDYCRLLVESPDIIDSYKSDIRIGLMRYYYDNGELTTLDEYLMSIDIKALRSRDRTEYIDYLVRRGMYEKAYETVIEYGVEEISAKICVRICSQMIALSDDTDDPLLIKLAYYAFDNGKYDLLTLKFLVDKYRGLAKEMRNLWRAAKSFDLECVSLEEQILIQIMYTKTALGDREEIFRSYIEECSGSRVELAYISYQAYEYFARERLVGDLVFSEMLKCFGQGEELNDACRLALLKHYAEDKVSMTPRISELLSSFLIDFLHRNIYYNFFKEYKNILPELSSYEDKLVIEYRANPAHRVVLHYLIEYSETNDDRYLSEEMRCLFGGVFSREFILFYGENLQYYITEEEDGGEERLTFSDSAGVSESVSGDDSSRYHLLNDMGVSKNLKDDNTLFELMREYACKDYFTERGFNIL